MNKLLILGAKSRAKASKIVKLQDDIDELNKRSQVELEKVDRAETDEEIDDVEKIIEQLEAEKKAKEDEIAQLEKEIEDIEAEIAAANDKKPAYDDQEETDGGNEMRKKMSKEEIIETRSNLNQFIRSQGRSLTGVKLVDGGALVPVDVLTPQQQKERKSDLLSLVNVVSVTTGSGKYPVIKRSGKKMNTVEELAENPELSKPQISKVDFSVQTYRGYIPVSQELIDDAEYDILDIVKKEIADQEITTKNNAIATVLKTATQKDAQGLDGLKDILNKEISSVYDAVLVVTDSMFAALDKVKDKEGRYMLQTDVTSPTGYSFAGRHIYRMEDDVIGSAKSEMKYFIGDVEAFVTLFDRSQTTIAWTNMGIYGQLLGSALRFDVKKTDGDAGVYGTYTDAV